jgi:hypothetical protein
MFSNIPFLSSKDINHMVPLKNASATSDGRASLTEEFCLQTQPEGA